MVSRQPLLWFLLRSELSLNQAEIERLLQLCPDTLTLNEIAAVLRVHPRSVQRWTRESRFTSVRAGRTYRLPRADGARWILSVSIAAEERDSPTAA